MEGDFQGQQLPMLQCMMFVGFTYGVEIVEMVMVAGGDYIRIQKDCLNCIPIDLYIISAMHFPS